MDAIVIGSGPNGLVAAATLARHGWRVLLLEAKDRPGGALYSEQLTLPGFIHDVGAAFFPFAAVSPAFQSLDLAVEWRTGTFESCHPAPDGSCASISRDADLTAASLGTDGDNWRAIARWNERMGDRLGQALLAPLPAIRSVLRIGLLNLLKFLPVGVSSAAGWSCRRFHNEAARRIVPGLSLHVDLGPHDFSSAGLGLVLALLAARYGFRVPVGGARSITDALLGRFKEAGGVLQLSAHVDSIIVRDGRAVAVRTSEGTEITAERAILADVGAPALFLKMLPADATGWWVRRAMRKFRYGWGTFKMDWALSGPVPWTCEEARKSAVVHAGDSIADLTTFTDEVRGGNLPENPYLVIGQQSLLDPSRAPPGKQTLWAYSHVPSTMSCGSKEMFADRIEERIEGLAPGFKQLILARAVHAPHDLEAMDENLVGGDLGGGSARFSHQLFFRPAFPYFRHATPVRGLYLASASAHPGAGVHGACGYNAARRAMHDYPQ